MAHARVLVTVTPSDADNVFITLTARQLNPDVVIIARAEQSSTPKKLRQAGANHVVSPAVIGAHRIVSLLTNPTAVEFAELVTHRSSLAIEMDDVPIGPSSSLNGSTLRNADIGRKTGAQVIAVKRADGRVEFPPSGDEAFSPGDSIVILGRKSNLDEFRRQFMG
jgi:voltage-gated potassium channel